MIKFPALEAIKYGRLLVNILTKSEHSKEKNPNKKELALLAGSSDSNRQFRAG